MFKHGIGFNATDIAIITITITITISIVSYRRVRRRAEMRAGAKLIAEGEDVGDDEEADKVLEKAERMRIQVWDCTRNHLS